MTLGEPWGDESISGAEDLLTRARSHRLDVGEGKWEILDCASMIAQGGLRETGDQWVSASGYGQLGEIRQLCDCSVPRLQDWDD